MKTAMTKTPEEIWQLIPEKNKVAITSSCWCSQCRDSVTIADYKVKAEKGALMLDGKCQGCGGKVVRVVD